jgi:hypothetical protein
LVGATARLLLFVGIPQSQGYGYLQSPSRDCNGQKKLETRARLWLIPKNGTHVSITGKHVLDKEKGHGWREIHPVTKVEVLSP